MITITHDTPIEVTKEQFQYITKYYPWACPRKIIDGRYWIKVWLAKTSIEDYLNKKKEL